MPQKLVQEQTEQQVQTLSSLQVALARLIELSEIDLQERVQNEMLENSALEEVDGDEHDADYDEAGEDTDDSGEGAESTDDDFGPEVRSDEIDEMGDYLTEDDMPSYLQARIDANAEQREIPYSGERSFYDQLRDQIGEYELTDHEREVMEYLIGSLDNDGFLRKDLQTLCDELLIYQNIETSVSELERLLKVLQQFEPTGIGARNLQECLRLQVLSMDRETPYRQEALLVIDKYFQHFTAKHWDIIRQRLGGNDEVYEGVIRLLTHLNPSPGSAFGEGVGQAAPTVVPDFRVYVDDEKNVYVSLNNDNMPQLRVSRAFRDSIKQYATHKKLLSRQQQEAYTYAKQKVESAQNFINMVRRRNLTLLSIMRTIVALQHDFFENDEDEALLRPMVLKDVAQRAQVDVSVVSRVTGSKYVETPYSIYPLKFFFSNQLTTDDGEEMSTRKVKLALREMLETEDKTNPDSDELLGRKLREKGFPVARRTVAKYREQMGFPVARLRKEIVPSPAAEQTRKK